MRKAPVRGRYCCGMDDAKKLLALSNEYAAGERNCWDEASAGVPLRTPDEVATDYAAALRAFVATGA